ncbi:MAG: hypothetical protein ACLQUZ_10080 [Rhizomicrobium sp.]
MKTFILALPASEVVRLLRAETTAALGQPELNTTCGKDYVIEEDFDRAAYDINDGEEYDLVTSVATLTIEPRVESGYWILAAAVERVLGPLHVSQEDDLAPAELTLDAFEAELRASGHKHVIVRLTAETSAVRQDFERWLADMRARHPWTAQTPQKEDYAMANPADGSQSPLPSRGTSSVTEVVGVFHDPASLEAAVDELEVSGFNRAAISVLATEEKAKEKIDRFYRTLKDVEDSGDVARGAFVSRHSRAEGQAVAVGAPLFIGGFAGALAVAASGGALALAIAAAIVFGAGGAGLGALLATAIADDHAARIRDQLRMGGLILWVSTPTEEAQKRAVAVLSKTGASDVHVHEYEREWSVKDVSLAAIQPDPLLDRDLGLGS